MQLPSSTDAAGSKLRAVALMQPVDGRWAFVGTSSRASTATQSAVPLLSTITRAFVGASKKKLPRTTGPGAVRSASTTVRRAVSLWCTTTGTLVERGVQYVAGGTVSRTSYVPLTAIAAEKIAQL